MFSYARQLIPHLFNLNSQNRRGGLAASLKKRWGQDVYITAVLLNLYRQTRLFQTEFLTEAQAYNIVERVYFRKQQISILLRHL